MEDRRVLAVLTVNSLGDTNINTDGVLTLREAVEVVQQGNTTGLDGTTIANQISGSVGTDNTIVFAPSLNTDTIELSLALGQMTYNRSGTALNIDASALNSLTIDANDPTPSRTGQGIRIFNFADPSNGTNPSLITLAGLSLTGSDVSGDGGAIRSESRLVLRDSNFFENEATRGGAIFVQVAGGGTTQREVLRIENSIIDDNDAFTGGGVAVIAGATNKAVNDQIVIVDTTFTDNSTTGNGGGLYARLFGADLNVSGASSFVLNDGGSGGAIFSELNVGLSSSINNSATLTLNGVTIDQNDASSGAGIFATVDRQSTFTVQDSILSGNEASNSGGGAYFSARNNSMVNVNNSQFSFNDANFQGGGLRSSINSGSNLAISNSSFQSNNSAEGGGVHSYISSGASNVNDSFFNNNDATGNGGGMFISLRGASTAEVVNTELHQNEASSGGGLFASLTNDYLTNTDSALVIRDSTITGNFASEGGGIRVNMPGTGHTQAEELSFTVERSSLTGNNAANRGGALFLASGAGGQTTISESTITGNDAGLAMAGFSGENPNSGGGVYAYLFSGDDPIGVENPNATANREAKLTIAGTTIDNNSAGQHGGGVFLCTKRQDYTFDVRSMVGIYNSTISGNVAGLLDDPRTPYTSNDPVIGEGGGIHIAIFQYSFFPNDEVEGVDVRFHNVTITDNTATVGGGIYSIRPLQLDSVNDTRLNNTIVSGNNVYSGLNTDGKNLWGSFNVAESRNNLIGDNVIGADPHNLIFSHEGDDGVFFTTANGNIFNSDNNPLLAPLENNGGLSKTHRPLTGSLAIDNGSPTQAVVPFTTSTVILTDQRGTAYPRFFNVPSMGSAGPTAIDIGAHEVGLAKVVDVLFDNPTWTRDPHSFAEVIPLGEQLRPFATQNVNTIQIRFSDNIRKRDTNGVVSDIDSTIADGNALMQLRQTTWDGVYTVDNTVVDVTDFSYDPATNVATWTFPTLADGKYAIHLKAPVNGVAGIVDLASGALDADWTNEPGTKIINGVPQPTWDVYTDDPQRDFATGNGTAGTDGDAFRFNFALLAGDYDGNGVVELGNESATGDGNGDNVIDSSDLAIGTDGKKLPLRDVGGADFFDNEAIDGQDLAMWQTGYMDLTAGDADGDGGVDGNDFLTWQRVFSTYSAWGEKPVFPNSVAAAFAAELGMTLQDLTTGVTPQVMNVIISGSQSTHTPFSFDTVDGSGSQLATVPVGLADTISIVFSENVNVSADSFIIVGLTTANVPQLAEFSYDAASYTATWRFEGWALGDNYLLHLQDSITDTEGNFLDGEWTNPASISTTNSAVSTFPSGDGVSGGNFQFVMTLLPGDLNLDGIVDDTDYDLFIASLSGGGGTLFIHGDFNGNGNVSNGDIIYFVNNWQTDLRNIIILADLNADGIVDGTDLATITANHGMTGATWSDGDLDGDGEVGDSDLDLAFAQWGLDFDWVA